MPRRRKTAGFSLIELLMVLAIVGILVAIVLPDAEPVVYDQLRSTAQILATDLAYARGLAVANNSNYKTTFDLTGNRYLLSYSGTNPALRTLPVTPFSTPDDTSDQHVVRLAGLPNAGPSVRLAAVATTGVSTQSVGDVEFGPLGQTTRADPTTVWLAAGSGDAKRFVSLAVNPVTGLIQIGAFSSDGPPAGVTQAP